MNDLNQIILEGRLTADPRTQALESGALLCTFSIASNYRYMDRVKKTTNEITTYMLIEAWRNVAEYCAKYLKKGDTVRVAGKLRQSSWERENNIKMRKTFISAEHVEFKSRIPKEDVPVQVKAPEEEPDKEEQEEINEAINETISEEVPEEIPAENEESQD